MQRLIFTTIKEGKIKLIMLMDMANGLRFPCIYYNGRQPLVAFRAIKAQQMRESIKVIICFQTRIGKYIEENNLPPKLSRCTRNPEFHQKVVPRAIEFATKSDFRIQNCNHRRKKHRNKIDILSRTNVVQLSKAIRSCAQKAKIRESSI